MMRMTPFLPLERMTRKWWLFAVLIGLLALPSYANQPLTPYDAPYLLVEVVSHGFIYWFSALFPLFKLIPLALIVGLWFFPRALTRWFHLYVTLHLLVMAFFANSGETPTYGFAILTGGVLTGGLQAVIWGWEAAAGYSLLHLRGKALWRYWVLIPALLAFAYPVRTVGMLVEPDFSPLWLITNEGGLVFCMVMPLYLSVLTLAYPRANAVVMRISGCIGSALALVHIVEYMLRPFWGLWLAVLHLPMLVIGVYTLVLAFSDAARESRAEQQLHDLELIQDGRDAPL